MILKLFLYIMFIIYLLQLIKTDILQEIYSRKSKLYMILPKYCKMFCNTPVTLFYIFKLFLFQIKVSFLT